MSQLSPYAKYLHEWRVTKVQKSNEVNGEKDMSTLDFKKKVVEQVVRVYGFELDTATAEQLIEKIRECNAMIDSISDVSNLSIKVGNKVKEIKLAISLLVDQLDATN